jgi:hypothetical protein
MELFGNLQYPNNFHKKHLFIAMVSDNGSRFSGKPQAAGRSQTPLPIHKGYSVE